MFRKVVFFNYYHNGDIHLSRGFIRQIINKVNQIAPGTQFYYAHRNPTNLLLDINVAIDPGSLAAIGNDHISVLTRGDTVYINTWYAQQHFRYMNVHGISMDTLYLALNDNCKTVWGFSLEDISKDPSIFFPLIDYSPFQIGEVRNWLSSHTGKKIFVSNGITLSGQAHNFDLTSLTIDIAKRNPDKTFILSNKGNMSVPPNVYWSPDIIKKNGCDLNENGFITEHCDVIIGQSSGAFSFAQTQENYLRRNCKILNFSSLIPKKQGYYWLDTLLHDKITYTANIISTYESNVDVIKNLMETHIQ